MDIFLNINNHFLKHSEKEEKKYCVCVPPLWASVAPVYPPLSTQGEASFLVTYL